MNLRDEIAREICAARDVLGVHPVRYADRLAADRVVRLLDRQGIGVWRTGCVPPPGAWVVLDTVSGLRLACYEADRARYVTDGGAEYAADEVHAWMGVR